MSGRPPREDPFGQRFLRHEDGVFDYNAWDNVDFPAEVLSQVEETLKQQAESRVGAELAKDLREGAQHKWDAFYQTHERKFFMDRKWLAREFPEIIEAASSTNVVRCLDVGCGVGNTTFPLLSLNENVFIYSCDFSATAVEMLKTHDAFNEERCNPFVWDITDSATEIPVANGSLDFILCIYVLSALSPEKQMVAVKNLVKLLKPGGMLVVKDYGRHDLTQLRFKKDRLIEDNFYRRGDDTLVYFFTEEELHDLFTKCGLDKVQNFTDKRLVVNRSKKVVMYRRWMQAKYVKSC